jgi:hypothetical protein
MLLKLDVILYMELLTKENQSRLARPQKNRKVGDGDHRCNIASYTYEKNPNDLLKQF